MLIVFKPFLNIKLFFIAKLNLLCNISFFIDHFTIILISIHFRWNSGTRRDRNKSVNCFEFSTKQNVLNFWDIQELWWNTTLDVKGGDSSTKLSRAVKCYYTNFSTAVLHSLSKINKKERTFFRTFPSKKFMKNFPAPSKFFSGYATVRGAFKFLLNLWLIS